jgi:hypothetical protein
MGKFFYLFEKDFRQVKITKDANILEDIGMK